ncbi:MAG TPA: hypothetical protein PK514_05485 [Spirochaetota bacterium]|nr:hypothetical protein [Spirochaetota bacterium]
MDDKKIFIGNLNFEVTEADVRKLLSKYGTVEDIRMNQKKGYALVEMSTADEAAEAVQKLDGTMYRDREVRINLEMKAGRARSASVRRYKERGESFSGDREAVNSAGRTDRGNKRDSVRHGSGDNQRDRDAVSSPGKYKGEYSERFKKMSASMADSRSKSEAADSGNRQGGINRRERPNANDRDRRSAEKTSGTGKPQKKEWTSGQPLRSDGPRLDDEKPHYIRRERPAADHRQKERSSGPDDRGNRKREWNTDKTSGQPGRPGNRRDNRPVSNQPREERSGDRPKSRPSGSSPKQSTRTSRPGAGESGRGRSSGSSRPDNRGGAGERDRNNRSKRD